MMAFNIKTDGEKVEVFLDEILKDIESVEENFLKKSANIMKQNVVNNLNRLRTTTSKEGYKHMADDVQARIVKDKYGDKVARVRGGKNTGTKWHIVNDGTYRSKATHFMDDAIKQTENDLETIVNEEMKKRGF